MLWQIYQNSTLTGANFQQKLLFVPNADSDPEVQHEISEPALFRYLLNEETIQELKELQAEIPAMLNALSGIDKNQNSYFIILRKNNKLNNKLGKS